ncbi:hypothetical protein H8J73_13385 [Ruminococcus bicirculans]|nr:hypothetical protein [Ruminococcus bicirculans (ex Wegman et al. 2014)]
MHFFEPLLCTFYLTNTENAVWVTPELVCTVKYMMKTESGGMRQPVFKGLREDKSPEECIDNIT